MENEVEVEATEEETQELTVAGIATVVVIAGSMMYTGYRIGKGAEFWIKKKLAERKLQKIKNEK